MKHTIERMMSTMWCCDPLVAAIVGVEPALILNHLLCIKILNDNYNMYEIGPEYGEYTLFDSDNVRMFFNLYFDQDTFNKHLHLLMSHALVEIIEENGKVYFKAKESIDLTDEEQ